MNVRPDSVALHIKEAAAACGVGQGFLRDNIRAGLLPTYAVGCHRLVLVVDLIAWVRSHKSNFPTEE